METLLGYADEDTKASAMWEKFKGGDVGNFLKSMTEQQKYLGKRGDIPAEDASPEEVAEFWGKLGVPAEASEYMVDMPEGYQPSEEALQAIKEAGKTANLTKEQFAKNSKMLLEFDANKAKAEQEAIQAKEQEGVELLEKEWGEQAEQMIHAVRSMQKVYDMTPEEIEAVENDPKTLVLLGRIAKDLDEKGQVGTVFNSTTQGLTDELSDVESQIRAKLSANGGDIKDKSLDHLISQRERIQEKLGLLIETKSQ
jgi:hypothetical protein